MAADGPSSLPPPPPTHSSSRVSFAGGRTKPIRDGRGTLKFVHSSAPRALSPLFMSALHEVPCVAQAMKDGEARLAIIKPTVVRLREEREEERKKREARAARFAKK